ncbi:MAG TPA: hypothetical protein VFR57_07535 [Burkholderiales bacterium]|nr:hypothetical protein [Burkholderiales bacterium]
MRLALAGLALAFIAGCSGLRAYPDTSGSKNLTIRTNASKVRAELDVHSVDPQCRAPYIGTVGLDRPTVAVGIPTDAWSYLKFDFASSSLLRGSQRVTKATLLRARAGHRYEVDVKYRDDIYDVVIRELSPRGATREVPLRDLASCEKS